MSDNICLICSGKISDTTYKYHDHAWNKFEMFENLVIYHCENCGLGFTLPHLENEKLGEYYSKIYRSNNSPFYFDFSKDVPKYLKKSYPYAEERAFSQILMGRFFCDFKEGDSFLDIGPGKGGAYHFAGHLLPNPKLYAIELTEGAPAFFKKNFNVDTYPSLTDFINTGLKAKMLLMSHSLEHYQISDIEQLFNEFQMAIENNGVLVIEVPHCDIRIHAEIRGNDTPHLLFFSKQSLSQLLNKYGFEVLFIDTCGELIKSQTEHAHESRSTHNWLKKKFRLQYNRAPIFFQNKIRSIVRRYYKIKIGNFLSHKYYLSYPQHTYGGNRNLLRVVAKKRINTKN